MQHYDSNCIFNHLTYTKDNFNIIIDDFWSENPLKYEKFYKIQVSFDDVET